MSYYGPDFPYITPDPTADIPEAWHRLIGGDDEALPLTEPCGCQLAAGHRCKPPWLTDDEWGRM